MGPSHTKIPGMVERVEWPNWEARLWIDGRELWAEMTAPLPPHARAGSLFTIHRTRRGHVYLHWITRPLITKRQVKKAKIKAREWKKLFDSVSAPTDGSDQATTSTVGPESLG